MADLETLTLQINTESQQAYTAIEKLAQRLDALSVSVAKLETGKLTDLAMGLYNLNGAIASMNATSSKWDYKRIITNISSLATINIGGLNSLSATLGTLTTAFQNFAGVSAVSENIRTLVSSISKLGGIGVQRAITNIPQLQTALSNLITSFSTLPNINQSIIDFTNALANLSSQGQRIGNASRTITSSLDKFSNSATKATKKSMNLASAIGKVYAQFWIAMRAASAFKKAFTSTADYLEAYNFFDVVAGKVGADEFARAGVGSADEYADAFTSELKKKLKQMSGLELDLEDRLIKTTNAKSLGLNLTDITQYQASIASLTNAMNLTQDVTVATSKALSMLAADMSSLRNVDYETAAQNLQSGITGMAKALYKYGIDITQAKLEQYAFNEGLAKSVSEMSQGEKAQLRLLAILDQSKVAWGDLANTINSPSNQLRQLKNNFAEVGTVLGQLFIPMMNSLLPKINGLSLALKQLFVDIAGILGIQLSLDEFGSGYAESIDEDTEALEGLNQTMKETKKGIREFDELKVIASGKDKTGADIGEQIDLTQQILDATAEYEKVWNEAYEKMRSKASEIAGKISKALEPIKKIIQDFAIGDFFQAGSDISELVKSIFNFVTDALEAVDWKQVGKNFGSFIEGIDWTGILSGIGNLVGTAIQSAFNIWTGSFSVAPFETAIITAFAILKFTGLGAKLGNALTSSISAWFQIHGIDQNFLAKAGLGAISIGLGISLLISNVDSISTSKYAANSFESLAKSAVSALLTGAGFTAVAAALGMGHLGLVFAVTAGISLAFNIIAANLNEPYENVGLDLAMQQYKWVEDEHLDTMDIITNINMRMGEVNDDEMNLDFLATQVITLSENYDQLSDASKELLKVYSEGLVDIMPELADSIDEVTGAYKGETDELEKLIQKKKAMIELDALQQNLTDVQKRIFEIEDSYEMLKGKSNEAKTRFDQEVEDLSKLGISQATMGLMVKGADTSDIRKAIVKDLSYVSFASDEERNAAIERALNSNLKTYEREKEAADQAFSSIEADYSMLTEKQEYYMGKYNDILEKSMEQANKDLDNGQKEEVKIIESPKLPNAVEKTMNKIDKKIAEGEAVSENDMKNMFNGINNSFAGLGDGKVPEEVQNTMKNIEVAILTGSPKLIGYMATLKKQMEEAFQNAHYDGNGEVIWDVNGITTRLDNDFKNFQDGLERGAKPTITQLTKDLQELFGGELPEAVNDSLKDLADGIEKGEGKYDLLASLEALKRDIVLDGHELGMNIAFGICGGVYDGTAQVSDSMSYLVNNGLVSTYQKDTKTNSPSRLFRDLAENIPEGIALGIEDDTNEAVKAMNIMVERLQTSFSGYHVNVPTMDFGTNNRNSYFGNYANNPTTSLYERMGSSNANPSQTEVVFRIEGDPHGMFKVVREENDAFKRRTNRSAFA